MKTDHVSVLEEYLTSAGLSEASFAARIGIGVEMLRGLLSGAEPCTPAIARRLEDATEGALDAGHLMDGKIAAIRFRADFDEVSEALLKAAFLKSGVVESGLIAVEYLDAAVTAVASTFDGIGAISGLARQDRLLLALHAVLKEIAADCGSLLSDDPAIESAAHEIRRHYQPSA